MSKPDPSAIAAKNLAAALKNTSVLSARIPALKEEAARVQKSIDDHIASGDFDDETRLHQVSGLQVRVKMVPPRIKLTEQALLAADPVLVSAIGELEQALIASAKKEAIAYEDEIAGHLEKYAPPYIDEKTGQKVRPAMAGVSRLPIFNHFPVTKESLQAPALGWEPADSGYDRAPWRETLIARAKALLSIAEEITKRGSWVPENFGKK